MLNEEQLRQIEAAIATVERQTDAELVTVLARQADEYAGAGTIWAALAALAGPLVLHWTPLWLEADELLLLQWGIFALLLALFQLPWLRMLLVPRSLKTLRAASLAKQQFLANNLHHTRGETGVLIFVAERERYVEIIADRGISERVDTGQWQQIVDQFTDEVKAGRTLAGFLGCIEACGELLRLHAPATSMRNELPDRLVLLG